MHDRPDHSNGSGPLGPASGPASGPDDLTALREMWRQPAPPSRQAYFQARAALMSRAAGTAPAAAEKTTRRRRMPRMGVRLLAVGAFAVTLAAGITVVQNLGTDSPGHSKLPGLFGAPAANAQEALERAAVAAERKPYVAPRPNQWIYTEERTTASVEGRPAGSTEPLSTVTRGWRRVDGTAFAYIEDGKLRIHQTPGLPEKQRHRVPERVRVWENYQSLTRLPTNPDTVLRMAYEAMRGATNGPGPADPDELVYTM